MTRLTERRSEDRAALDALLDEVWLGHVAFIATASPDGSAVPGYPVVLPTLVARDGDRVLLHGSTGSRWMRHVATGADISLAVTAADAIIVARSAFESSMRYRSAVLFGRCTALDGEVKLAALQRLTEAVLPGRVAEVRPSTAKELAATLVLALPITEWSLKVNAQWPDDPAEDVAGDAWAGVVPIRQQFLEPLPTPDLRSGIAVPQSVLRLAALGRER